VTCFFDASHGPGRQEITWSPQWGAPRPVLACPACAQRWTDHLQGRTGYPQPNHPGYQGYPDYAGYPQDHSAQRRGYGAGSVVAAGAAGFVGGMIVNEMFDNDEVVEHVDVVDVVDDYGDYGGDW
jgi:tellurium resistance protein TerD